MIVRDYWLILHDLGEAHDPGAGFGGYTGERLSGSSGGTGRRWNKRFGKTRVRSRTADDGGRVGRQGVVEKAWCSPGGFQSSGPGWVTVPRSITVPWCTFLISIAPRSPNHDGM